MTPTDPHVPVSEEDDASTPQPHTIPSMVVAIGASAGGHEPLEQIFTRLTTDTGLAFVVLMHLTADSPSHLVDLLRHYTTMPVVTAEEALAVQPDTVYAPARQMSEHPGWSSPPAPHCRRPWSAPSH